RDRALGVLRALGLSAQARGLGGAVLGGAFASSAATIDGRATGSTISDDCSGSLTSGPRRMASVAAMIEGRGSGLPESVRGAASTASDGRIAPVVRSGLAIFTRFRPDRLAAYSAVSAASQISEVDDQSSRLAM